MHGEVRRQHWGTGSFLPLWISGIEPRLSGLHAGRLSHLMADSCTLNCFFVFLCLCELDEHAFPVCGESGAH